MLLLLLLGFALTGASGLQAKKSSSTRIAIDHFVADINGDKLPLSDLNTPRIAKEGSPFSLDEAIIDRLFVQYAKEMHLLPTSIDVERQFVAFKQHNNLSELSDEEFDAQLKEGGFTLQSYKSQLAQLMAVENVKRAEVSEKTIVSSQEVEEYYKKHPEYTKEAYHIHIATVPTKQFTSKEDFVKDVSVKWEDHGMINAAELSDAYSGVKNLSVGAILDPIKTDNYYDVVKLVAKQEVRLKTLAESYSSIERIIQNKRRANIIDKLTERLIAKAHVIILDKTIKTSRFV
jgi:parvulin-like peptidyl-prolyl isomerase